MSQTYLAYRGKLILFASIANRIVSCYLNLRTKYKYRYDGGNIITKCIFSDIFDFSITCISNYTLLIFVMVCND